MKTISAFLAGEKRALNLAWEYVQSDESEEKLSVLKESMGHLNMDTQTAISQVKHDMGVK